MVFCEIAGKYGLSLMAWDDGGVHSVIDRFTYQAYDGDDFLNTLNNKWKTARAANPILTTSLTDLPASGDWGSADVTVTVLSAGDIIKLSLSKISGASYSQIRICSKDSWTSLTMDSINVDPSNSATLETANPTTDGKNITLTADNAVVSYTLTADDCTKINSAGGIALRGFGVKIAGVSLVR